jgi:glycosyltransferase involved in cell wall biosynthesis
MRLFFPTFEFPPRIGGGLATYLDQICKVYAGRGDEVTIFSLEQVDGCFKEEEEIAEGVRVIRFAANSEPCYRQFGYWPAAAFHMSEKVAEIARRDGPADVIEIPDGFGIGYMCLQRRLTLDPDFRATPIVTVAHTPTYMIERLNDAPTFQLPNYWTGVMEKFSTLACDALVSPSQALLDRLAVDIGRPLPRSEVIRNPYIPPAHIPSADAEKDHFYVASRLTYWKGVDHIARVFERLWSDGVEAKLKLYGGDTDYNAVGRKMSEHLELRFGHRIDAGLLEFCGPTPRAEIDKAAATAHAQIHPSLFDNFPYSVLESMGNGQVTLVNCNGGHNEIIADGVDAMVMNVENPEAAAEAVSSIISMSDEARRRMGDAARATVARECGHETFYARKAELYEDVIAQKAGRKSFPFIAGEVRETLAHRAKGIEGRLSVVIPYFNMAAYIDETVDSVFASTWPDIEVVLVDDGSAEPESLAKLEELKHRLTGRNFRVLSTVNQGVAAARNTGAEAATGALMALLDADDVVQPDYYANAIQVLKSYDNVAFVGCWNEDFRDSDGSTIRIWATYNPEPPAQLIFNMTNCQGMVYWREAFLEAGKHDPELRMFLDDWESVISLMAAGLRGVMLPQAKFRYRIRDASIFRSKRGLWDVNFEKIARKHAAYYDKFGAEIAAFLNANGPNTHYHVPGHRSGYRRDFKQEKWIRQAYDGKYVDTMRFVSDFLANKTLGKFIRRSKTTQWLIEKVF